MADVFISYHRSEGTSALVRRIARELDSMGISCWYDTKTPTLGRFADIIEKEIDRCKVFLFIWDDGGNQSDWCLDEVFSARDHKKLLIPFQLGQLGEKRPELLLRLRGFNALYGGNSPKDAKTGELTRKIATILQAEKKSTKITNHGRVGINVSYTVGDDGVLTISGHGSINGPALFSALIRDSSMSILIFMMIVSLCYLRYLNVVSSATCIILLTGICFFSMPPYKTSHIFSVYIETGITSIGAFSFSGYSSLTKVTIPESVICIKRSAFSECRSLAQLTIPESVRQIGDSAFEGCKSLTKIIIPHSVARIEDYTFWRCANLAEIIIPNGVTYIGKCAFDSCANLAKITIPNGVTYIGKATFNKCSSLTEVMIPNSVTRIEKYAFANCTKLTKVDISSNEIEIDANAFRGCINLRSIRVSKNARIDPDAFPENTTVIRRY